MPVIDGKPRKARFTSLKLDEVSSVDRPAQEGARAVILKRDEAPTDKSTPNNPDIEGGNEMAKTIEQLEAELAKLQGENTELQGKLAKAEADCADMKDKMSDMEEEHGKTKKALSDATDEVVKVGGEEFRKSEVGEPSFRAMKAMAAERDVARFEKQAQDEYPSLVGTVAEKALVLKARAAMGEDAQKALDAILTAAEKMTRAGFDRIGTGYGAEPTEKAARATFDAKVSDIAKRDGIGRSQAMSKARREFPEEFATAYPQAN